MVALDFDTFVFKEGNTYIAYCLELDLSSCGDNVEKAKQMLKTAVRLFLEEAENMGTLQDILEEANYIQDNNGKWIPPRLVATELVSL